MPEVPADVLYSKLKAALPANARFVSAPNQVHPAVAEIPRIGTVRIYLWTVTHVESADRPQDEYKIQLILPGQRRDASGELELDDASHTMLLGYSPDYGVFVAWQPELHQHFSFSSAVQVKEGLLIEARDFGWAVAPPRHVAEGDEVRTAFSVGNLHAYLLASRQADANGLDGIAREAFLLQRTPRGQLPAQGAESNEDYIVKAREKLMVSRWSRDSTFSAKVREEYSYSCALCQVQLNVVEGAHIVPVNQENGVDKVWNGIALCKNHHRLFDGYAFIIKPSLEIVLVQHTITFYEDTNRAAGLDVLLNPFEGEKISKPAFFNRNAEFKEKMKAALRERVALAGLAAQRRGA